MRLPLMWLLSVAACATAEPPDVALELLQLQSLGPTTLVPGSAVRVKGASFVDEAWGESVLRLVGELDGVAVDVSWPARFVNFEELLVDVAAPQFTEIGAGQFVGTARVEVTSAVDGETYPTAPRDVTLELSEVLTPDGLIGTGGVVRIGERLEVDGGDLLLGGREGQSVAVVAGCFRPRGATACAPVATTELPVYPTTIDQREQGWAAFAPSIAGIAPGEFEGTIELMNRHASGVETRGGPQMLNVTVVEPAIFSVGPNTVRLGQYLDIRGGGFVGGESAANTVLEVAGTITGPDGVSVVELVVVPDYVSGELTRYVINEDDALADLVDLRSDGATVSVTLVPVTTYHGVTVRGTGLAFEGTIAPPRQIVYLDVRPTFVESLRAFGMRALAHNVLARMQVVAAAAYATIGVELRTEPPTDYALYAHVELHGRDPNGRGLFGYDNTPGKDIDNVRLYDQLGGVNAATQADGALGYGGVFLESLFAFSAAPIAGAPTGQVDALFDQIFDFIRPDRGGTPVRAADAAAVASITTGASCPAATRAARVDCAVFVLGNLVGTTLAHELGHSLGLANPYGDGFHNVGDEPNRLMDSGEARSFAERAQLGEQGPGRFCDAEYIYLRTILPTDEPDDSAPRPSCD